MDTSNNMDKSKSMDDSNSMNISNSRVPINSKDVINSREANNDDFENVDLETCKYCIYYLGEEAKVEFPASFLKVMSLRPTSAQKFFSTPREHSEGMETSAQDYGPHGGNIFRSIDPFWVVDFIVGPCNSVGARRII